MLELAVGDGVLLDVVVVEIGGLREKGVVTDVRAVLLLECGALLGVLRFLLALGWGVGLGVVARLGGVAAGVVALVLELAVV